MSILKLNGLILLQYNQTPKSRIYLIYVRNMVTFRTVYIYENWALLVYYSPRNNSEECSSLLLRCGSLKSCTVHIRSKILHVVRIWLIFETVTSE